MVSASSATSANTQRQLAICPSQVAIGTPTIVATVRPSITRPTACVRCAVGTSDAATSEAIPK